MSSSSGSFWGGWRERIRALRNVPPLLQIVWHSGPRIVTGGILCRVTCALMPIAMLWVSKRILDSVQARFSSQPLPDYFWWLVGAEAGLAALAAIIGRTAGYFDALLADRFTRHVSVRVMQHASRLDL